MTDQDKIHKMAADICRVKHNCNDVCNPINTCMAFKYSKRAYEAGYRRQSEVIDEFVKRLLDAFPECNRDARCPAIYYDDYREIIEELALEMKEGEQMNMHDATEQAYKNGYAQGKADAAREIFEDLNKEYGSLAFLDNVPAGHIQLFTTKIKRKYMKNATDTNVVGKTEEKK